jgi:TPP-dependent pyruvate/acetoin dehydrogenase alpha subunit
VLDAYAATGLAARHCRGGQGPVVLSAETFRMGGHATHDEREARELIPADVFAYWGARDPIGLYEEYLAGDAVTLETLHAVEAEVTREVEVAEREALASQEMNLPRGETALDGVYAPVE